MPYLNKIISGSIQADKATSILYPLARPERHTTFEHHTTRRVSVTTAHCTREKLIARKFKEDCG